jgi:Flp pilus assembly protein TadD
MHSFRDSALSDFSQKLRRIFALMVVIVAPGPLAACGDLGMDEFGRLDAPQSTNSLTIQDPGDDKFKASDEAYRLGVEQFNRGYYGNAQKYFQQAVERSPQNVDAWISLAACYDHLRRFDFADKAYDRAIQLGGRTVQLLNNLGYSYVLRGDLREARQKFKEALKRDPGNIMVQNNLKRIEQRESSSPPARG